MKNYPFRNDIGSRFFFARRSLRWAAASLLCATGAVMAAKPAIEPAARHAVVKTCPSPEGEPLSEDFCVTVGGRSTPVYTTRVSAKPLNYIWPGFPNIRCDRPLDQTGIASFAYWDVSAMKRGQTPGAISLAGCLNARIEGVIIRDVNRWAVVPTACEDVTIAGLKLIGFWRHNADGINVVVDNLRYNGKRIVGVENCGMKLGNFVKTVRVQ